MYIHELKNWPTFHWDQAELVDLLAEVRHLQGLLLGKMSAIGFSLRQDATLQAITQDVLKTSEIEGEKLDVKQVRSSIAKRLGLDIGGFVHVDKHVEGIVEILLDATGRFEAPISKKRLCGWHSALFPTGHSGIHKITVGSWRTEESGPMRVISGPLGRERIHFEAPKYERVATEMDLYLTWFNTVKIDPVIKAAISHFWFLTIHPFDDGNGRIARAIADLALARSENSSQRFYSMSSQILKERKDYYAVLESSQKGSLDITDWLSWFLHCLKRAITASDETIKTVLVRVNFWKLHANQNFNERQLLMLKRLLDNFEGKLTSSKWAKIAKCSQDTALRDIEDLISRGILLRDAAGGRSTNYSLVLAPLNKD